MKILKSSKLLATLMSIVLLVGCGTNSTTTENISEDSSESTVSQSLIYNLGVEPATIDPTLNNAQDGSRVILNAFEGLMTFDENDQPALATAESYEVSEDGLVYTFKIREDAKWSDGEPVVAENFRYSWLRALNRETGAEYAYQFYYIKNGEAYYNGEVSEDEVGIKVIDDLTLEVTLETPTSYFLQLCAFANYVPLREDIVSADPDGWTNNPETYVSNGPFKLVKYDLKDQYVFEKNEYYWDKDSVILESLTFKMITDNTTAYAELKSGNFDVIASIPTNEYESAIEEGYLELMPSLAVAFFAVNVDNHDLLSDEASEALSNKLVRQALNLAIDRQEIIDNVSKSNPTPAYSFVPQGILDEDGNDFADRQYFDPLDMETNIETAKELLKEAGYENGEGLPTLQLMYSAGSDANKNICEIIQQNWLKIGVNVELTTQEWAVFFDTLGQGDYNFACYSWSADYVDPMTFLDIWVSDGGNNHTGFSSTEYDELIDAAKLETDSATRFELLKQAEDILMEELPVFPLWYSNSALIKQPNVKGIIKSALGGMIFKYAYKE